MSHYINSTKVVYLSRSAYSLNSLYFSHAVLSCVSQSIVFQHDAPHPRVSRVQVDTGSIYSRCAR